MLPRVKFRVNLSRLKDLLPKGAVAARITSDATNPQTGFNYFFAVDQGRGPVRPVRKKALRWLPGPRTISPLSGRERFVGAVFSKRAGPFGGHRIRKSALLAATPALNRLAEEHDFSVDSLRQLVNRAAALIAGFLARYTPRKSSRLARSYEVEEA